jgi:choline dehydrogenase-like flavoprotein
MHGRYPDFDVLSQQHTWDEATRAVVAGRLAPTGAPTLFTDPERRTWTAFADLLLHQHAEPRVPVVAHVERKLDVAPGDGVDGFQYADLPSDLDVWRRAARGLDEAAAARGSAPYADIDEASQAAILADFMAGRLTGGAWDGMNVKRAFAVVTRSLLEAFYSHPWTWNEMGFGGPAYPRGYMRLGMALDEPGDQREPWEQPESATFRAPLATNAADRGSAITANPTEDLVWLRGEADRAARIADELAADPPAYRTTTRKRLLRGAIRPQNNESAKLLDVHRRAVPQESMRRYDDTDEVDLVVVGAGAGGGVLAQRLARAGWRVVVIESGPFWDPDRDFVSDEAGSHHLYWNGNRILGGTDPVELGKNNSGHGVGGSMVHYAGYVPRFHPSDFITRTLDGVNSDWPLSYWDLVPHYEAVETELPAAGQDWPWGHRHRYPHTAHPISGAAERLLRGAGSFGMQLRVGPVGIANGTFGNRPHCIYRGFCLQGCKVNAKGSPLVTHIPDAIAHGAEIRADSTALRVLMDGPRAVGIEYARHGVVRRQRAALVAVAGYSIESPRLLLNSAQAAWPSGVGNHDDQVGRYVMVQGAPVVMGRFPDVLRGYKAPPPEVSTEQFYETDPDRGFRRGFSIQTTSPMPIGFAENVLGEGHWGDALREYGRDYNHWTSIGALCELLAQAENRVSLADVTDHNGQPVARFDYSLGQNDRRNIAYAKRFMKGLMEQSGAQDLIVTDRYAHLIGGNRMGFTPRDSVVNADHQVWGTENLLVADGSACPTQGSANPALTIMALSSRLGQRLATRRIRAGTPTPTAPPKRYRSELLGPT